MVKLVEKKWQSKVQHTKRQVLHRCLATFSRGLSFIKKQGRSGKKRSCSETTFAVEIPDDIVKEILHRIPLTYLARCKLVSKKWHSRQVLHRYLARLLSFHKKQGRSEKNPISCIPDDIIEEILHHSPKKCHWRRVLDRCLASVSRVLSFLKKQGRSEKNPDCIPDAIIEEILHRIPAKYLVKWKPVSKGWKSLIESDHLAEKHLHRRQKMYGAEEFKITFEGSNSRGFRINYFSKYDRLRANNGESEAPRVSGSCNGLVCVFDLVDVSLFNPTTGVIRTLARLQGTKLSAGFGRDGVTGRYKVVVLYRFDDNGRVETLVFDLSTSEWRWRYKTAGPMPLSFTLISPERNPVFVNGSVFWLVTRHHDHSEILVMDLHTEKFRTVSLPKDIDVSSGSIYMWSLKGRLCVSDLRQGLDSDVWNFVHDELGERWERTRFAPETVIPPFNLNSAWFSQTLVSPYQPSSSRESACSSKYLSSSRSGKIRESRYN